MFMLAKVWLLQMNEQKEKFRLVSSKKTRYILPNILTLSGVCCGISSIKFSIEQNFTLAVILIILASILDALDGRIARLIKGTSEFGKELDSLTDFVSFGIAPALIIYFWDLKNYGKIGWLLILIFSVCCVLRLARFNLNSEEKNIGWKINYFEGIPAPAGGILILIPLIFELSELKLIFEINKITPFLIIIISVLMISKIPTFSLKKISIKKDYTIFIMLFIGVIIVSLIFFTFETVLFISTIYLLSLPFSVFSFYKLKKVNKTEPDEDEDVL